jgi:hypothetical protein
LIGVKERSSSPMKEMQEVLRKPKAVKHDKLRASCRFIQRGGIFANRIVNANSSSRSLGVIEQALCGVAGSRTEIVVRP